MDFWDSSANHLSESFNYYKNVSTEACLLGKYSCGSEGLK